MPVFVDTNVLVYAHDAGRPEKQSRASSWIHALWSTKKGRISTQVLKELYNALTRKLDYPLARDEARQRVRVFHAWRPVPISQSVLEEAWQVEDRYSFSFWDALIVAAARSAECEVLLTEDLQDGQDLDGLRVVSPFSYEPGDVLAATP